MHPTRVPPDPGACLPTGAVRALEHGFTGTRPVARVTHAESASSPQSGITTRTSAPRRSPLRRGPSGRRPDRRNAAGRLRRRLRKHGSGLRDAVATALEADPDADAGSDADSDSHAHADADADAEADARRASPNIDGSASAPTTEMPRRANSNATRPVPQPASKTVEGAKRRTNAASPCTSTPDAARSSNRR